MDEDFMKIAIEEAELAAKLNEVPIGAAIVKDGIVVSRAHNCREIMRSAISHAEIAAIDAACRKLGAWRLTGCTLYVTLEPCIMCAGAAINARMERIVYGARDSKSGACGSALNVAESLTLNHRIEVLGGVRSDECSKLISDFFKRRRHQL